MRFVDVLNLINLCLENDILKSYQGKVFIYDEKEKNWTLMHKFIATKELSKNKKEIKRLIYELEYKGIIFSTINGTQNK